MSIKLHTKLIILKVCLNINRGRLNAARGSNMDRKEKNMRPAMYLSACSGQKVKKYQSGVRLNNRKGFSCTKS